MVEEVESLAERLNADISWLSVRTADQVPDGWVWCSELITEQQTGADPTAGWRKSVLDQWARQYGADQPAYVAAMFVLMWCVSVPALVAARSAALTGVAPEVRPEALAFRRHPVDHYPAEVALLSDRVLSMTDAAEAASRHCREFVESYRPGVKLSSRQRYGAIEDEFRAAIPADAAYATEAARAFGVEPAARWRTSCCLIYALPGVRPCTNCPRLINASS